MQYCKHEKPNWCYSTQYFPRRNGQPRGAFDKVICSKYFQQNYSMFRHCNQVKNQLGVATNKLSTSPFLLQFKRLQQFCISDLLQHFFEMPTATIYAYYQSLYRCIATSCVHGPFSLPAAASFMVFSY